MPPFAMNAAIFVAIFIAIFVLIFFAIRQRWPERLFHWVRRTT